VADHQAPHAPVRHYQAATRAGLRHAFGVGSLQAGVPLNLVQRWLGHARISTTAIYAALCGPDELCFAALFWQDGSPRGRQALQGGTYAGQAA
jgi:site-specific recombinase XerC